MDTTNHRDGAESEQVDTMEDSNERDSTRMIMSESQCSMHARIEERHYPTAAGVVPGIFLAQDQESSEIGLGNEIQPQSTGYSAGGHNSVYHNACASAERSYPSQELAGLETFLAHNRARYEERNIGEDSDEHGGPLIAPETGPSSYALEGDEGHNTELDTGEPNQSTHLLPEMLYPFFPPNVLTIDAPPEWSTIASSSRGTAMQIKREPAESDTEFTEAHRMFLEDELLSEDDPTTHYNLDEMFDSLKSTFSAAVPPQVQSPELTEDEVFQMATGWVREGSKSQSPEDTQRPELQRNLNSTSPPEASQTPLHLVREGRSVPEGHNSQLPKRPAIDQPSGSGRGKRMAIDAGEASGSRVRREYQLVTEHSEEAYPRVFPSTQLNYDSDEDLTEIDWEEFEQHHGIRSQGGLENDNWFQSHYAVMMGNLGNEIETIFGSNVQHKHQKNSKEVGDPCALVGNYEELYEREDEALVKTMGWFPVEEYCNENLSVRWILDEAPSASDLPHLESLKEISPSKFWSPESDVRKRHPPVHFGYLCRSEPSPSSHSVQYSPASSPKVTRTILGSAPGGKISFTELNRRFSEGKFSDIHEMAQKILTPCAGKASWTRRESIQTSMKPPSGRRFADAQFCIPEVSPAFSADNHGQNTREREMASHANQDQKEKGCVPYATASASAACRLIIQCGKNLVMDFLKAGTTTEQNIECLRNDVQRGDNLVPPSSTLWAQGESCKTLSLEGDGNRLMEKDSPPLRPLSSPVKLLKGDENDTRKRDASLVPLSDISNHPKLESDGLHSMKLPVSKSHSGELLVTQQCQELAPDNIAWSPPVVPRVSRRKRSRLTIPKGTTRVGVPNMLRDGNDRMQPARTTPNEEYYTVERRKRTPKSTFAEHRPMLPRNVKMWPLNDAPTSDRDTDLRNVTMPEGISVKPPILIRIVKPLRHMKTTPSKGCISVRIKTTPKGVRKRLLTESRNVSPLHTVRNSPINHHADVTGKARSEKDPGVSAAGTQKNEVGGKSLSKRQPDCETSKTAALRTSKYRGVTRHRHTGRFEAHLWDNSNVKLGLAKRGRQVYLGAYPDEDQAAQAHDLAALKYWGPSAYTNFPISMYEEELKSVQNLTKEEYILILRRRSPGFTRGLSKYRGVTRHHQEGRWEARIGRHSGAKYHYLGTYDTQEEAAMAYDRAAVRNRGANAITNFDISNYIKKNPRPPNNMLFGTIQKACFNLKKQGPL